MAEDSAPRQPDLIYGLEDTPPFWDAVFAALQHLLAMFVAVVTPPLIIASALKLDTTTTGYLVSMSLVASGISSFIQCRRFGKLGAGLLCVQGTSYSFIAPIIAAGQIGGLPLIFGSCMAAASLEMLVSVALRYLQKIITPLVSGIVVTLIGLSLVKVGIIACGGGYAAMENGNFGNMQALLLAGLVLITIVICNQSNNKYLRMSSIVTGLIVGYIVAWFLGLIDFNSISGHGAFHFPVPFRYGLDFSWSAFIALGLIYIITSIEAYGDITANSQISGLVIQGKSFMQRAQGGILADGFNSMLASMLGSFPNSIFAQNNGLILLTGIASRRVGYYIAAMLVLLGLFPYVGLIFSLMPEPVLGGATLLMFGTVAAAGIRILLTQNIDRKASLVIAISLAFGIGVEMVPDILNHMPQTIREIFSSGITTGSCAAILSNLLIRIKGSE